MTHKHTWEPYGGCDTNPGVFSQGKTMSYTTECKCGATRLEIVSVHPQERGEWYRRVMNGMLINMRDDLYVDSSEFDDVEDASRPLSEVFDR